MLGLVSQIGGGGAGAATEAPVDDAREEPMVRFLSAALDHAQVSGDRSSPTTERTTRTPSWCSSGIE